MEKAASIVRDFSFYEKLINKKRVLGLHPEALSFLWQVQRNKRLLKQNYNKFYLLAGIIYSEIKLWEISNSYLLKIAQNSEYMLEASVIIANNYLGLNKKIKALIFIEKVLDENENFTLNNNVKEIFYKIKSQEKLDRKNLLKKDYYAFNITHAKTLIRNGFYEDATILIEEVPSASACFLDARNLLTTIYILKRDYKKAKKQAYLVINKSPKNIFNCCNFIKIALQQKNNKMVLRYTNLLSKLNLKTIGDYYVSGITYASLKMHKKAFECLKKVYEKNKYYKKTGALYCIAAFNAGEKKFAIKNLIDLINVYPSDKNLKDIVKSCKFINQNNINLQLSYNVI